MINRFRNPDDALERAHREITSQGSDLRQILSSYQVVTDRAQALSWCRDTTQAIIAAAVPGDAPCDDDPGRFPAPRPRAYCPLCQAGSCDPYMQGFLLDEGLRRHLLGVKNAMGCSVFAAAHLLARTYFRRRFPEQGAARVSS